MGGGGAFVPLRDKDNTYQLNGLVIYSRGQHTFKMGAALIRRNALNFQDNSGEGAFTFHAGLPGLAEGIFSVASRNNNLFLQASTDYRRFDDRVDALPLDTRKDVAPYATLGVVGDFRDTFGGGPMACAAIEAVPKAPIIKP